MPRWCTEIADHSGTRQTFAQLVRIMVAADLRTIGIDPALVMGHD
jgi:hypothetical protein